LREPRLTEEEFLVIVKSMMEIIARIDRLLHEALHGERPELRKLGRQEFPEFEPEVISKAEFEKVWAKATA
jgi:hypothetical protein